MIKKIKWILLTILIVSIIITLILFFNFTKENKINVNVDNNNSDNINVEDNSVLDDIYNKHWYVINMTISDGKEELFRNQTYNDRYIIINKESIEYCDSSGNDCKIDKYVYRNNMLSILTDNSLGSGDYVVKHSDYELKLIRKVEDKTISYYLEDYMS